MPPDVVGHVLELVSTALVGVVAWHVRLLTSDVRALHEKVGTLAERVARLEGPST